MTIAPSTNLFYDRTASTMSSLTAQIARANQQITAQTNILAPSDNSVAWQRLQDLSRADADDAAYSGNVSIAKSVLAQSDTALGQITDQLQQISTLLTQAASGTITPSGKSAIASQLSTILTTIVTTANASDIRGGPLFGGSAGGTAVVQNSDGSLGFADGEAAAIPIGAGQSVQPSNNAASFLKTGTSDLGTAIAAMIAALNGNTDIPTSATDTLKKVTDQVVGTQASIGARAARVDIVAGQIQSAKIDRSTARTDVDGFDYPTAITDLQKTMTVLQATQASFTKLSGMSLFDYLR